jgi:hypothetical protein
MAQSQRAFSDGDHRNLAPCSTGIAGVAEGRGGSLTQAGGFCRREYLANSVNGVSGPHHFWIARDALDRPLHCGPGQHVRNCHGTQAQLVCMLRVVCTRTALPSVR